MIETLKTTRAITLTLHSTFQAMIDQIEAMSNTSIVMGQSFDASQNDDFFYLPPEAFGNPEFLRGVKMFFSPDGKSVRFFITHQGDPMTPEGIARVSAERTAAQEGLKQSSLSDARVYLGGTAATFRDMADGEKYDLMIAVVSALTLIFMIMLLLTRSVVAALVIVGTASSSIAASFGLSVLIWQDLFGMHIHWIVAALSVIILLAVGSDYNLLLVSRFREEIHAGLKTGYIRSMAGTGAVVTSAGLVFAFTMAAMLGSELTVLGQFGSTVCIGLLLDTLVVRTLFMPSLATMLGRWFWWPQVVHPRGDYAKPKPPPAIRRGGQHRAAGGAGAAMSQLLGYLDTHRERAGADVQSKHRAQVGDDRRLTRRQPLGQRADQVGGSVGVGDMMHRDRGRTLTDDFAHPVDHRRDRLAGGADPLRQNKFAVVDAQQRLERQLGAQPGTGTTDAPAAPQVVQLVDDDEPVIAAHRRSRRFRDSVQVGPAGRCPGGGQRDETRIHRGRLRIDHPDRWTDLGRSGLGGAEGSRQRRRKVHRHYPIAAAVGQRLPVCLAQFCRRGCGGGGLAVVMDVVGNIVHAVTQVAVVEQDVQGHLAYSPLPTQIAGKARRRVSDHHDRHVNSAARILGSPRRLRPAP